MTSTRSYRKALPLQVVIEELRKNAGSQFDPELVDTMIELVESGAVTPCGDEGVGQVPPEIGQPLKVAPVVVEEAKAAPASR
jgi:hypothetical protein